MISFYCNEPQYQALSFRPSIPQQLHSKKCFCDEDESDSSNLIVDFPSRPRTRAAKSVRFAETSTLHQWVDRRKSPQDSWQSKSDYKAFRRNLKHEVVIARNQMMSGVDVDDLDTIKNNEISIRGMEHLICPRTLHKIMDTREAHKTAVLEEQFRQISSGCFDSDAIRSVSKENSKWGKARAWAYAGGKNERMLGGASPAA